MQSLDGVRQAPRSGDPTFAAFQTCSFYENPNIFFVTVKCEFYVQITGESYRAGDPGKTHNYQLVFQQKILKTGQVNVQRIVVNTKARFCVCVRGI